MSRLHSATDTLKELALYYTALILVCSAAFMLIEGQSFATSLYWAGATATSTGYGDISPKTQAGQILALVLMHLSIFIVAPLIVVRLIDRLNANRDAFTHEEQLLILDSLARIEERLRRLEKAGAGGDDDGDALA